MQPIHLLFISLLPTAAYADRFRIPFLQKKQYTPLVFFTVPKDLIPECDEMEKVVRSVEKELGVRVERLDILRDPSAEAALALLTSKTPPFLYHRESCQVMHVPPKSGGGEASSKDMPISIDVDRVRAWAKGRYLPTLPSTLGTKVKTPIVLSQKETAMDQDELLEDMALTPIQRKGKQAIKERTEQKAKKE